MISLSRLYILVVAAVLALLSACGGGSEGGTGGSGISAGIVQDQNSTGGKKTVQVNGVTFETANTTYSKEGTGTTAASIQNGMVVVVQGTIDANGLTGVADSIAYADLLEGPITAIGASSITAMGQTILVDGNTLYSGGITDLAGLLIGDVIQVSGFHTADSMIYATYIEKTGNTTHEIKGVITALTATNFNIGNLLVNTMSTTGLNAGDFVRAEGMMSGDTTLMATSVMSLSKNLQVADANDAEIEGLATTACTPANTLPCSFTLGFITIQVSGSTAYEGGLLSDIHPGTRLEVEGRLQNNEVIANEIKFRDKVELTSDVSAIDSINSTFDLEYGVNDVTVVYDPLVTSLNVIADLDGVLSAGHVKVRARVAGNSIIATRIENSQGNSNLVLQGPVGNANNPNITILGVTIDTNTSGLVLKDRNGMTVSQAGFFNLITANSHVNARGTINSGVVTWDELRLDD